MSKKDNVGRDKAIAIPQRHSMQCDICMLLDTDKKIKFHLYEEGYTLEDQKYVCNDCLEGIKDIRRKCNQKVDNPTHKIMENWVPWFAAEVPGLVEAFKKQIK